MHCASPTTATSNALVIGITPQGNPTVSILQTSGTNPQCNGASVSFTATVSGGTAPAYQWLVDGNNAGSNNPVFTTTSLTDGQTVSCSVTATPTCPLQSSVTLGTGTNLSSTTSGLASAYPTYYGNGRQQYLIRATELTGLGLSAGTINSLGFTINSTVGDPCRFERIHHQNGYDKFHYFEFNISKSDFYNCGWTAQLYSNTGCVEYTYF